MKWNLEKIDVYMVRYRVKKWFIFTRHIDVDKIFYSEKDAIEFTEKNNIKDFSIINGERILPPTRTGKGIREPLHESS